MPGVTQHTAGPWIATEMGGTFYVFGPRSAMVCDGETEAAWLTRIRGVGRGASDDEQRANAELIAASPDLEAALQTIAATMCVHGTEATGYVDRCEPVTAVRTGAASEYRCASCVARAALRKAGLLKEPANV